MSKFTTEVRYICDSYASAASLENETQYNSINEKINASIPYIFSDDWDTFDHDHKEELCRKILRHYYMHEIGFETVGLWKLNLNTLLGEIMPKYNVMYQALSSMYENLLGNVSTTETRELTGKQSTTAETSSTNSQTTSNSTTGKNTGSRTGSNSSKTHNEGTGSGSSDSWQESNDTPQGGLNGLESRQYLSNAVHNRATNSTTTGQDATASGDTSENTTQDTSSTASGTQNGATTGHSTGSSDNSESYTLKITGKNSGTSYLDEMLKMEEKYNDIDVMIINDLSVCFMGLWE